MTISWKLNFPIFNVKQATFHVYYRWSEHFSVILFFLRTGHSKIILGPFSSLITNILPKTFVALPKPKIYIFVFVPRDLRSRWLNTRSPKAWRYLEVFQTRFMPLHRLCFKLMRLLCPAKPAMTESQQSLALPVTSSVSFPLNFVIYSEISFRGLSNAVFG